jgi:regulator of nucleoside diphosphate kinase
MRDYPIIVSDFDVQRLRGLLANGTGITALDDAHLEGLRDELERALVMPAGEMPHGVVTMGSKVQVRNLADGRIQTFELVYPRQADASMQRVSVLAPLGTALLGNGEGDIVEWQTPGGTRSFRIERVVQAGRGARPSSGRRSAGDGLHAVRWA